MNNTYQVEMNQFLKHLLLDIPVPSKYSDSCTGERPFAPPDFSKLKHLILPELLHRYDIVGTSYGW